MERRLFEDLVVSRRGGRFRAGGMPVSFALHAMAIGALLALTMVVQEELPIVVGPIIDHFPVPTARAAPTEPAALRDVRPPRASPRTSARTVVVPIEEPIGVLEPADDPEDTAPGVLCVGCAPSDDDAGSDGPSDGPLVGDPSGNGRSGTGTGPVRVGGLIQPPRKLRHVDPVYPELAKRARVAGVVVLECLIDREGRVRSVQVVTGIPLLDASAVAAVRQWAYSPTLLNGVPVEVVMTVTVRFTTVGGGSR